MKLIALHCPYCGGNVKFDADTGKKFCFCIHCGQQIIIDDEVQRSEHKEIIVDQAKIQEQLSNVEIERIHIEEERRKDIQSTILYVSIIVFCIIGICFTWLLILLS